MKIESELKFSEIAEVLKQVAPETIELLENRYNILKVVSLLQPIGRRVLSTKVNLTERIIRKEANILKEQGLLEFSLEGMTITDAGLETIEVLSVFFRKIRGIHELETKLKEYLNIKKVIIAPMVNDDNELTLDEIGRKASSYTKKLIDKDKVIGITGGSTVYTVINQFKPKNREQDNLMILPARGGLGRKSDYQANTLVEKLAEKLNCQYKLLYTPDWISEEAKATLLKEPEIKEIVSMLEKLDILIFGIARADVMAKRRQLDDASITDIAYKEAVAEAFGYYFDKEGNIVHEITTIGVELEKLNQVKELIAVAGGVDKAEAIAAVCKINRNLVLVTDEEVAKKILNNI
nr:sugar-binding domain-containing protein [Acidaminobacter sp. JC074]